MATNRRVYFEASVFVAIVLAEEGRGERALAAVTHAQAGLSDGFISALVVAESVGCPNVRAPQGARASVGLKKIAKAQALFDGLNLRYVEGGRMVGCRAGTYVQQHNLRGPDALHLALAEQAQCGELHTFDTDLLKIGTLHGMEIMEPHGFYQTAISVEDGPG